MSIPSLRHSLVLFALLAAALASRLEAASAPRVLSAMPLQYSKIEFDIDGPAAVADPYDPDEVRVDLVVNTPSGASPLTIPCFFDPERGLGAQWRARFTPSAPGNYDCFVRTTTRTTKGQPSESPHAAFNVSPSTKDGFLRRDTNWAFRFDSGKPFRGIGENICWESRSFDDSKFFKTLHEDTRFHYEYLLQRLSASGGNSFRTWMCAWNLPLEWKQVVDTQRYSADNASLNRTAMRRLDELFDLCESLNVHTMLTLDTAGAYLGRLWDINSYNLKNGGTAQTPLAFFTQAAPKEQYKKRLRYIVARWGYSTHIAAWEFFNEIDNLSFGLEPALPADVITAWHDEMSRYLKEIDPYKHLVTTSVSHRDIAGLNQLQAIDFNQKHIYKNTLSIPSVVESYSSKFSKPYVIGEFGYEWDWSKDFRTFAPEMRRDFRRGLWLGLFSPTPWLPMSWWWEYFDQENAISDFTFVRKTSDAMLADGNGSFTPLTASWSGPKADVYALATWNSRYALLVNPTDTTFSGTLVLPPLPTKARVTAWNTASQQELPCEVHETPVALELKVSIPASGETLVILQP